MTASRRILVTGANGFVGRALVDALVARGFAVSAAVRGETPVPHCVQTCRVGDLGPDTDWRTALNGCDGVVHLAARVHVMREAAADPLAAYRIANVAGTVSLARQAAAAGVRRLVFLSSVKVNGEAGVYSEADPPAPEDPYGISKLEAEVAVRRIADNTGMECVVVRAPLVYGPGVKGNFRSLLVTVARGVPLPLGAIRNQRSFVALDNLVDFVLVCLQHPAAANEVFLVSDGEDISTADLIRRLARAMGRPARLIPVPPLILKFLATLTGKREPARRVLGSLQVNITKARRVLGWAPQITVDEALRRTVALAVPSG